MGCIASMLVFSWCTLVLGLVLRYGGDEPYKCKHFGLLVLLMEGLS